MDWGQALRILNNARVSRAHEALAALLSGGNSRHLIPIQNGFGLDFVSPGLLNNLVDDYYDEEEDDYYYDDEEEEEDYFFSDRTWKESPPTPLVPHPRIKQLTTEEEEKRAADLLREEERRKEKIEKKRQKRMRQKENRRLGRLNAEKDNGLPNDKEPEQPTASSEDPTASSEDPTASSEDPAENMDTHFIRETETDQPLVDEPDPTPTETEDTLPEEGNGDSVVVEEEECSRESEELDMNSSFICTTAAVVKKRTDQKRERKDKRRKKKSHSHKPEVREYQNPEVQNLEVCEDEVQEDEVQVDERPEVLEYQNPEVQEVEEPQQENIYNEDSVQRSTELANIGNLYAGRGQLDVAVQYFTDAIKHNPTEYKLFGNRSFCYEKMQQYDCALADADLALSMEPGWTKGLFRKGKALCGLKRYYEASVTYEEVLKQDGSREDASQELLRVRVMQLMEMGFSWERSLEALNAHRTFEEALEALSGIEGASAGHVSAHSPEEEEEWIEVGPPPTNQNAARIVPRAPSAATARPKPNTRGPLSAIKPAVWVGSVVPSITEARLHTLFSRAGEVFSVKMLEQQCAFVHYTRQEDCDTAIQLLNGFVEEGACLVVRHPTARTHPAQVKKNWQHECYFWRTTGHCCKRDCAYIHISEHKGIDKAKTAHQ